MKYLYILTSDDSDFFLEQMLLSVTTMRFYMPNAIISLLTDDITEKTLTGKRNEIKKLINEIKIINFDKSLDKKYRSRFLKTTMRQHINGDFFYIDSDTIITENLSDIFSFNIDIGLVLDKNKSFSQYNSSSQKKHHQLFKKLGLDTSFNSDFYYNGGVMLCRDKEIVYDFFKEWNRLWLQCVDKGYLNDQPALNQANYNLNNVIKELPGEWNYLITKGSVNYLYKAKIIHYLSSTPKNNSPYIIANNNFFTKIKETGIIDQKVKNILTKPKELFEPNTRIILYSEFEGSALHAACKKIFYTKFGTIIESIFKAIQNIKK